MPLAACLGASSVHAQETPALASLLGDLKPGPTVSIPDGTYTLKGGHTLRGLRGTTARPIVIRPEHRGRAIIAGGAGFIFRDSEHVVLEGFVFGLPKEKNQGKFIPASVVGASKHLVRPQIKHL